MYILAADHFRAVGLADVGHTGRTLAKDQMTDKVGNTGHSPGTRRSVDRQRAAGTTISAVEMVILGHTLSLLASDRYPICGIIQGDAVFNLSAILKPDWLYFWKPNWLYAAMPLIYYLSGVTAIIYFDTLTGRGAGVVLMLTAGLIWVMRIQNRKRK